MRIESNKYWWLKKKRKKFLTQRFARLSNFPILAEQEAQAMIEKAKANAVEEARQLVANAEAKDECARIQAEADEKVSRAKSLSASHFESAVAHVIDRVIGRE